MNVSLNPELDQFVSAKVSYVRYTNASDVIREGLRLLEERDQARAMQLASFNQKLSQRIDSLDRGQAVDPGEVRKRLRRKAEARRERSA